MRSAEVSAARGDHHEEDVPAQQPSPQAHGFLVRMRTKGGQLVLKRRRQKGRKRLAV
jgi:large subunit ribosomal protein L34